MPAIAEQEHVGKTKAMENHDHDLVHELSKRLDAIWRYDQYIANAADKPEVADLWQKLKQQDLDAVDSLRSLMKTEMNAGCF